MRLSASTFRNAGSSSLGVSTNSNSESYTPSNPERDNGNNLNLYSHEGQGKYPDPYNRHLDQGTIVAPRSFLPSKLASENNFNANNNKYNDNNNNGHLWGNNNQEETENGEYNTSGGMISNRSGFTNMKAKGRVYGSKGSDMNQQYQEHQYLSNNASSHDEERGTKEEDFESLVKQEQELMQLQLQQDMMEKEYRAQLEEKERQSQQYQGGDFQLGKDFSKEDFEQAYREVLAEQEALKTMQQSTEETGIGVGSGSGSGGDFNLRRDFGGAKEQDLNNVNTVPPTFRQEAQKVDIREGIEDQGTLVPYKHVNSNAMSSVFSQDSNLEEDLRQKKNNAGPEYTFQTSTSKRQFFFDEWYLRWLRIFREISIRERSNRTE